MTHTHIEKNVCIPQEKSFLIVNISTAAVYFLVYSRWIDFL